ncbi:MAG: RNA 2'-phosphotransferase [Candidatus Thermoplasmatota archaeon]|jgi:putative RNA 2'-phosphotransferase|nr:RNA 2'-phosphotransferase [Candidatus Thermoplasmatota archaeon]
MLGKCDEHGYFRGDVCPVCKTKGKFLMSDRELDSLGRIMAGVLRHFPEKLGVSMDGHGWVDISEFVEAVGGSRSGFQWLRDHHIEAIAVTDPKGRYQVDGGMIRATYGHTIDIKLDDLPLAELDEFFYPVTEEEIDIILEGGLNPIDRKNVHLSGSMEKAIEAGKVRTEIPLILRIDGKQAQEDGIKIYHAGKDVYITERIDAKYISKADTSDVIPASNESISEEHIQEEPQEPTLSEETEEQPPTKPKRKTAKKTKKTKPKKE